eukprot:5117607-Alexandrium_andersonii.AAC.1
MDANARVGSLVDEHVGPAAAEPDNWQGELLHDLLRRTDVFVPLSFPRASEHSPMLPLHTWQATNGAKHRLDY